MKDLSLYFMYIKNSNEKPTKCKNKKVNKNIEVEGFTTFNP
jgi:hypothetical protein